MLFPIYKLITTISRLTHKITGPINNGLLALLGNSMITILLLCVIIIAILIGNLNTAGLRQDETSLEAQRNSIFKLTADISNELIEEKVGATRMTPVYSYLDDSLTKPIVSKKDLYEGLLTTTIDPINLATEETLIKPTISATTTNLKLRDKTIDYTILAGDTIGGISQKFGLSVTTILWANNLTVRSYIKPGQSIIIPPVNGLLYKIKANDTLAKIAKTYKTDLEKILIANKLANAQSIRIGQELILPDAEKPTPIIIKPKPIIPTNTYAKIQPKYTNANNSGSTLLWPTDWRVITQYYSWRHTGLDIDGTYETRNIASADGLVTKAQGGWNGGYGLYIIIDHGQGMETLYAHNSKIFVQVGDRVARGQIIGMVGSTGRSTGTHLHYEVRQNGQRINPLTYIR